MTDYTKTIHVSAEILDLIATLFNSDVDNPENSIDILYIRGKSGEHVTFSLLNKVIDLLDMATEKEEGQSLEQMDELRRLLIHEYAKVKINNET